MDKLRMQSTNGVQQNIEKIQQLFPDCVTETIDERTGELVRKVDFEKLQQNLSDVIISGREERYQFTWPDKKKAILLANSPVNAALRPCREESVDFDNTQNLYIEGDNLDVLKCLKETYLHKVKMIYIDPPYNTGNDFVYKDNFAESSAEYFANSGQFDEQGNRLVTNTESNGRFHTDWLNMIYSRLKVARDLLSDNGVIFVSIGQQEIDNICKLMAEIYGADNKIGIVSRVMKSGGANGRFFSPNIEYIVVYAKNIERTGSFREPISEEIIKKLYTSSEISGPRKGEKYRPFGLYQSSLDPLRGCKNQRYYIEAPDGSLLIPPGKNLPLIAQEGEMVIPQTRDDKVWRWSLERFRKEKKLGNIEFKQSKGVLITSSGEPAAWNVYTKIWLSDRQEDGATPVDLISKWENRQSAKELQELDIPFDFAKPSELIKYILTLPPINKDDIILDFFSGSATTAHAVMQLNAEDEGKRKFIMVQLPEVTDEKSDARKAGYANICEIGKERIRRAGKKIKEDSPLTTQGLDTGFRVLKLDSSNMEDIYYTPKDINQANLFSLVDNVKSDRTAEDLLFQVMLELGATLDSKIETEVVADKTIYNVADDYLVACFDKNVTDEVVTAIAKKHPLYAVLRDISMANDSTATNFEQIFKTYSPDTVTKIL